MNPIVSQRLDRRLNNDSNSRLTVRLSLIRAQNKNTVRERLPSPKGREVSPPLVFPHHLSLGRNSFGVRWTPPSLVIGHSKTVQLLCESAHHVSCCLNSNEPLPIFLVLASIQFLNVLLGIVDIIQFHNQLVQSNFRFLELTQTRPEALANDFDQDALGHLSNNLDWFSAVNLQGLSKSKKRPYWIPATAVVHTLEVVCVGPILAF